MSFLDRLKRRFSGVGRGLRIGSGDWKEEYLYVNLIDTRQWDNYLARQQRYQFLFSLYENSPYSKTHPWTLALRSAMGLYAHTRPVFNPIHQLCEWYAVHIFGGAVDLNAGSGEKVSTSLPVITKNEGIRKPLSKVWRASNLPVFKSVLPRYGASMADTAIKIHDDPDSKAIRYSAVLPHTIRWLEQDCTGKVYGYQIEEVRPDPLWDGDDGITVPPYAVYTEEAFIENGGVRYKTYRDGLPFDWREYETGEGEPIGDTWWMPYPFVPLVPIQHINMGLNWGWSEPHSLINRVFELDDVGSCTTDQSRKLLNGPWAINTKQPPDLVAKKPRTPANEFDASQQTNVQGRDAISIKWIDKNDLKVVHMVGNMPMGNVILHTDKIRETIYHEFPELALENLQITDSSGRAIRILRQRAEAKCHERRVPYDSGLVRAGRMAMAMGRLGGYPDFAGLPRGVAWDGDELDWEIGKRPVFAVDPMDELEEELATWNAGVAATTAGLPLEMFLERLNWPQADIDKYIRLRDEAAQRALDAQRQSGTLPGGNPRKPGSASATIMPPTRLEQQPMKPGQTGNPSKPRDQRQLPGPANK